MTIAAAGESTSRLHLAAFAAAALLVAASGAAADCTTGTCIPGGGSAKTDCYAEFTGAGLQLNYPPFNPAKPKKKKELRCFDGDAGCDSDGVVDHQCVFNVDLCLFNQDPALPACSAAPVTSLTVASRKAPAEAASLRAAALGLPSGTAACTAGETITVPLGQRGNGTYKQGKGIVKVKAATAGGTDSDVLKLRCLPRGWPSHGYDHANTRTAATETAITTANAGTLVSKWVALFGSAVTSTPTVGDKLVYASSWDGVVYALKKSNGSIKWQYDTGTASAPVPGLQSSLTLTADGRLVFGDSRGVVRCLDARKGTLLWQTAVGDVKSCAGNSALFCDVNADCGAQGPCNGIDHFWSSPTIANGRILVGIASHGDTPCTPGRLVALDLDSGDELWRVATVPERICQADTTIACTVDGIDPVCPGSGQCVRARGGGITATVATDPSGETVFMATVGCFTFPSVGNSDSIFSIDAASGAINWVHRTQSVEQFAAGPPYHDYGFLNGPIYADLGAQRAVIALGKDGVVYARDADTGAEIWTNVVGNVMGGFGGFGLFNGAAAYAGGRLISTLNVFGAGGPAGIAHLQAWNAFDGSGAWQAAGTPNPTWASLGVAGDVAFAGTGALSGGTNQLFAYDATSGVRLNPAGFTMPNQVTSGASIVDGVVYVGYGVFAPPGGVAAFELP